VIDCVNKSRPTEPDIYDANRTDADELAELCVQFETNGPIIKPYKNAANLVDRPSLCGVSDPSVKSLRTYFCETD